MFIKNVIGASTSGVLEPDFTTMCYNIWEGFDETGKLPGKAAAIEEHIDRVDPDFITINEIGGNAGKTHLLNNFTSKGYNYNFHGSLGTYDQLFLSKIPFTYSQTIDTVDWSRKPLYVEMTIEGKTLGVISVHLDSSCSGLCHDDSYLTIPPDEPAAQRRTIQILQIIDFINSRLVANPSLEGFIIQGDFNLIYNEANVVSYTSSVGESYLPFSLSYTPSLLNAQVPDRQFAYSTDPISLLISLALNGSNYTWWESQYNQNPLATVPHKIDYIAHSTNNLMSLGSEVLNSLFDSNIGLEKVGNPLGSDRGYIASDHLPVFAKFKWK